MNISGLSSRVAGNQQVASSYRDGGREKQRKKETDLLIQKFYFWNSFRIWIMPGIQALETLPSSAVATQERQREMISWGTEHRMKWGWQSVNLSVCLPLTKTLIWSVNQIYFQILASYWGRWPLYEIRKLWRGHPEFKDLSYILSWRPDSLHETLHAAPSHHHHWVLDSSLVVFLWSNYLHSAILTFLYCKGEVLKTNFRCLRYL